MVQFARRMRINIASEEDHVLVRFIPKQILQELKKKMRASDVGLDVGAAITVTDDSDEDEAIYMDPML